MRRGFSVIAFLAALAAVSPSGALAQSGLSWHFDAGVAVPLSSYTDTAIRLDDIGEVDGETQLTTRLVDAYVRPGFQFSTTFLLSQFELRYALQRMAWDREETACTGSGPGVVLPSGGIDDTLVAYDCFAEPVADREIDRSPVFLHVLSLGYRFYFLEPRDQVNVYGVFAPGLGISSYNPDRSASGRMLGLNLALGTGVVLSVSKLLSLALEVRYNLFLSGPPSSTQAAANRARVRGQSAWSASFNGFHYMSFSLGFQLSFR